MRWIDIDLRNLYDDRRAENCLDAAVAGIDEVPLIQANCGLDHPRVVQAMRRVGGLLFRTIVDRDPLAFSGEEATAETGGDPTGDGAAEPVGYHLVVPPSRLGLPWTWLHNSLAFLLEKHPVVASTTSSGLPAPGEARPWMRRCREALNEAGPDTAKPPARGAARPEILFVPGHCRDEIRSLIYREADGIRRALAAECLDVDAACLNILDRAITPTMLNREGALYQGLHFAAATSQPLDTASAEESAWLHELTAASITGLTADGEAADLEAEITGELEVVGVDPVTALLDAVSARAGSTGGAARSARTGCATLTPPAWLLEDGPFQPEEMGRRGPMPALVFSNSHCSLPDTGARFLQAGASVFVGSHAAIYSRPARVFAGSFYRFLASGADSGTALRQAALHCRDRFGPEHPAWLTYGLAGYGTLALQFL